MTGQNVYGETHKGQRVQIVDNFGGNAAKDYYARVAEESDLLGTTQIAKYAFSDKILVGAPKILSNDFSIVHPGGVQVSFVSDDAGDDIDDTVGVRKLIFQYWDSNWELQTEVIDMQGLTEVNSIGTDVYRIEEIRSISTGTSGGATGEITVSNVPADVTLYAKINETRSIFERCLHYVAPGAVGVLKGVMAGSGTSGGVSFIAIQDNDFSALGGGPRVASGVANVELSNGNALSVDVSPPLVIDNRFREYGMALGIAVYATVVTNQKGSASMNMYEYTP